MKLVSIELTNYRRFKNTTIEFPEGVIGILGLNGVGKSTIIEAVAWALYGNQQTIVRTKKEDLKRYSAAVAEECQVKLAFELAGDKYIVIRKMAGKNYQTTAEVSVNGRAEATSTKAVTELIVHRLGMDYQAFYTSVFAKQKELNALSDIEPNRRKKLILRMLNIDSIDKAIISVHTDKKVVNTKLSENRLMLRDESGKPKIELFENQIKEYNSQAEALKKDISQMKEQKKVLSSELTALEGDRNKLRKVRGEHNKISTQMTEAQTSLKNLKEHKVKLAGELESLIKQEAELEKLLPKKKEWERLKVQKDELEAAHTNFVHQQELEEQLKVVNVQIKKHESKVNDNLEKFKKFEKLDKEFEEFHAAKADFEKELEEKRRLQSELNAKENQKKSEKINLDNKLKNITELGPDSACPTCERKLGEHHKILEEKFKSEIKELNGTLTEIQNSNKTIKGALKDMVKRQQALNKRERYLTQQTEHRVSVEGVIKGSEDELQHYRHLQKQLKSKLKEYEGLKFNKNEYDRIKDTYLILEKENEKIITLSERVENIPRFKEDLVELDKTYKTIMVDLKLFKKQLKELGFDDKLLTKLENKCEEQVKKLKEHEIGLLKIQNSLDLNQEKVKQLRAKINELTELEKKIKIYEDNLMYLTKLDAILNKFKNYMISREAPTLTRFASDLFRELTDGKYNRLEVDTDYNVYLYDDGTAFPLNRYSGGEEDLANLCLRLAISEVITAQAGTSNLNFIILDEVFGSQDMHRKRNLLQALNGLTNKFRQIFLITHIEDVKDFIEYNISVVENNDGTSSVKVI